MSTDAPNIDENVAAISVRSVTKEYAIFDKPHQRLFHTLTGAGNHQKFTALADVSCDIFAGESVGIIGSNGAGKSTLLQIICGTLSPSGGDVSVNGKIAALLELGAGFNPEFTGLENVRLYASILGLTDNQIESRLEEILAFADIGDFIDQPVKTYSSGMYVRLAFAVIAHVDADILIIDEALAVGDAIFMQKCMRFIRGFTEKGTLLFVSHNAQIVVDICDKAVWLKDGSIADIGPAKDVCSSYAAFVHGQVTGSEVAYSSSRSFSNASQSKSPPDQYDVRSKDLKASVHRNEFELFKFNSDASWWGEKGAEIINACFLDTAGNELTTIEGEQDIQIKISCLAHKALDSPVVGFFVKNNRGLELFGDNTFLSYRDVSPPRIEAGEQFTATFGIRMPYLPTGEYALSVAVANGDPSNFIQQHRVDEAMIFNAIASHVVHGVVGLRMHSCYLQALRND